MIPPRDYCAVKRHRRFYLTVPATCLAVFIIIYCIDLETPTSREVQVRLNAMRRYCRQHPPKRAENVTLITNREGTLEYCHVPKAASTLWMKVFAALHNDGGGGDIHERMLRNHGKVRQGGEGDIASKVRFLFVRHPFRRLASAYHDKFTTHAEPPFVRPVADYKKGVLNALVKYVNGGNRTSLTEINFEVFTSFVLHELRSGSRSYGSLHWVPTTKLCDICAVNYSFVGKVETLEEDIGRLQALHPDLLTGTVNGILNTKHNNLGTDSLVGHYFRQLGKERIMELEYAYREDFEAFGYPYPSEYVALGKVASVHRDRENLIS